MPKVSLCITILNEAQTILSLLQALLEQTASPEEIIIVDGGSTDATVEILRSKVTTIATRKKAAQRLIIDGWLSNHKKKIAVRCYHIKGNRSIGRNLAITNATHDWIAITDAGCVPHPDWLEQLIKTQLSSKAVVVAGYYDAVTHSPLQEAIVPYVLVMPDKVDAKKFLPATRSMLIHKKIWKQAGGFDTGLSDNEDYAFANKIARLTTISFAKAAKVSWLPPENLQQFHQMIFRFARGDFQAGLIRPKVVLLVLRYVLAVSIVMGLIQSSWRLALLFVIVAISLYSLWSIAKNIRYVPRGWYWLPVFQFTTDLAVILGSFSGALKRFSTR